MGRNNEPACTRDLPSGYYLVLAPGEPERVPVYLYDHADFCGVRHLSYFAHHGGVLMPVTDLLDGLVLIPVEFKVVKKPCAKSVITGDLFEGL